MAIYLYREDRSRQYRQRPIVRRSVSSMKDLMPLSLQSQSPPTDTEPEPQCFPELLARDLELSCSVFEAKNMTSGSPSKTLIHERSILTSPYQSASRTQTLGAIEERDSVVSFLERKEEASDADSLAATESSGGVEGPSIGFRQQSIITAATSLTSASGSAPSPKALMSGRLSRDHSWIDVDSDDEVQHAVALSPRPPSPLTSDSPFQLPSATGQHSLRSVDIPPRITSLACTTSRPQTPCAENFNSRKQRLSLHLPSHARYLYQVEPYSSPTSPPEAEFDDLMDDDGLFDSPPLQRPSTVYIQHTPPPSPLPTVEAWLDSSNAPFVPQLPVEDLQKAVPLPPDIIETLRVSIACFPETMLLSSSLTIETIRTYSKKVRHPSDWREPEIPHQSLWKKVVSTGRESISTCLHRTHHEEAAACPSAWAPLRHVFGTCSDYICDALYAHIVAYNYISRVPRAQSPQRLSTSSRTGEDIPKKAASLLGLDSPPHAQRTKKFSPLTSLGLVKDDITTSSAAQDNATRNIEAGLLRCIIRLINTAKMMAEQGCSEERLMEVDPQHLDMIFVRSLCEIVRISEDAMN